MKKQLLLSFSALLLASCSTSHLATSAGEHRFLANNSSYISKASLEDRLKRARIDTHDLDGNTILHIVCGANYHPSDEALNAKNETGGVPTTILAAGCASGVEKDYREGLQFLIDAGADVNATNKLGNTPLFYAAQKTWGIYTEILLKNGADADILNKDGDSILRLRALALVGKKANYKFEERKTIALIIATSSKPNQGNGVGRLSSPIDILRYEASTNSAAQEMLAMLIMNPKEAQLREERIAQLPVLSQAELSQVLQMGINKGKSELVQLCLLRMANLPSQESLLQAAYTAKQNKSAAAILAIMPSDDIFWLCFAQQKDELTKRLAAGGITQAELDRALLECCKHTEPYKSMEDDGCCCTIDQAIDERQANYRAIVSLLEEYKAVDTPPHKKKANKEKDGNSITWVSENTPIDTELVQKLLAAGANPNARDEKGVYALRYAMSAQDAKLMRLLLKAGADPNISVEEGQSLLHLAKERATKRDEPSIGTDVL